MSDERVAVMAKAARRHVRSRLDTLGQLAWIPAALFALFGPLGWLGEEGLAVAVLLGSQVFIIGTLLLASSSPLATWLAQRRRPGGVRAAHDPDEGLSVSDIGLSADELAMAWARTPLEVEALSYSGDEVCVTCANPQDVEQLVASTRGSLDRRRAYPVALEGPTRELSRKVLSWFVAVGIATMFVWAGPAFLPAVLVGLFFGWLGARGSRRIRFGADGMVLEGRFKKRYIPYRDIRRARVDEPVGVYQRIVLELRNGKTVGVATLFDHRRAHLVHALIEEGMTMADAGEQAGAHVAALDRAGEDAQRWRERLRSVVKESGYRAAAIDADALLSLMRNPAAKSEQRLAAALALRTDPGGVARIRVAAEVSAEPEVRSAFEELAESDVSEARLGQLLRKLERAS